MRGGRAEFGRDARQWVFEEWKYRRGIFECVAWCSFVNNLYAFWAVGEPPPPLPVNIISGRQSRSMEPGVKLKWILAQVNREDGSRTFRNMFSLCRGSAVSGLSFHDQCEISLFGSSMVPGRPWGQTEQQQCARTNARRPCLCTAFSSTPSKEQHERDESIA